MKPAATFFSFMGLNRDLSIRIGEGGARAVSDVYVCWFGV